MVVPCQLFVNGLFLLFGDADCFCLLFRESVTNSRRWVQKGRGIRWIHVDREQDKRNTAQDNRSQKAGRLCQGSGGFMMKEADLRSSWRNTIKTRSSLMPPRCCAHQRRELRILVTIPPRYFLSCHENRISVGHTSAFPPRTHHIISLLHVIQVLRTTMRRGGAANLQRHRAFIAYRDALNFRGSSTVLYINAKKKTSKMKIIDSERLVSIII